MTDAPDSDNRVGEDVEEEYSVEKLVGRRQNPDTGALEYLVKWLDYPDDANTWEPIDHLNCQDLIDQFNTDWDVQLKSKKKNRVNKLQQSAKKKKLENSTPNKAASQNIKENRLIVEDDDLSANTKQTTDKSKDNIDKGDHSEEKVLTNGFGTHHESSYISTTKADTANEENILEIVTATVNDHDHLFFVLKRQGKEGLEIISSEELEERAPKLLCKWYRERMFSDVREKGS